jgi:hypothetical protein
MNADIEQGLADYVTAQLTAAGFTNVTVLPGTSGGTVPKGKQSVVCLVALPHTVDKLYLGDEEIIVSTPAQVKGIDVSHHKTLAKAVREIVAWYSDDAQGPAKATALDSAVFTASKFRTRGFFLKEGVDAQNDEMWQTRYSITLGLEGPLDE